MGMLNYEEHIKEHELIALRYPEKAPVLASNGVTAQTNPLTGGSTFSVAGAAVLNTDDLRQSVGYHFHGWAPNQRNSDLKFLDYSGALNDAAFQTNLDAATAWATAGFVTQPNPTVASNVSLITIPPLSFDYLNGDNLFVFWQGRATPKGSDAPLMGDTSGASAGNGLRVVVSSTGKLKVNAYQKSGSLSRFGGTSTATVFETATTHSFAFAINGADGTIAYWADGLRDAAYNSGFLALSGGGAVDTTNASTFKLGGDGGTAASIQVGVAAQHQALVILKGRRAAGSLSITALDSLVAALHRNPQKLITASGW